MRETSVVVAGGGVVGLTTALGLARAGVEVTVYDDASASPTGTADAVYHWSALPVFSELGVLDSLVAAGTVSPWWGFVVPERDLHITFDIRLLADEIEHPFHLAIERDAVVAHLVHALAHFPSARVERETAVVALAQDPAGVNVQLDGPAGPDEARAGWIVGADGAGSRVRQALGLGLAGHTWPERLVSTTVGFDLATLGGPPFQSWLGALQPALANTIENTAHAARWRFAYPEPRALPEESVRERMTDVFGAVLPDGADPHIIDWSAYRMHERVAETFRVGRALLVGDAAHLTNPTSGLGMPTGLFDASSVIHQLPRVLDGADQALLDRAAQIRRAVFCDQVSPASAERKNFVFDSGEPGLLDARIGWLRELVADHDATRSMLRDQTRLVREPLELGARPPGR